jgi:hypothetical protein
LVRKGRKENTERTGDMRGSGREKITVKGTCERREIIINSERTGEKGESVERKVGRKGREK